MTNKQIAAQETESAATDRQMLFLVPLVQMAWAHGAISPREKKVIFDAAREDGIDGRHDFNDALDRLLVYQPSREFFSDNLAQIEEQMRSMTVKERAEIREKILNRCRQVAATAGDSSPMDVNHGISSEEKSLLEELTEILK